jgi:hypothetical protein
MKKRVAAGRPGSEQHYFKSGIASGYLAINGLVVKPLQ